VLHEPPADAKLQYVVDGEVHDRIDLLIVKIAVACVDVAFEVLGWLLRHEQDYAAGCILAEQGACRPGQRLYRRQVPNLVIDGDRVDRYLVEIGHHAVTDAPYGVIGIGALSTLLHAQGRHELDEIGSLVDVHIRQRLAADGGDGDRHVLQAFIDSAGVDDDLVQSRSGFRAVGRCGGVSVCSRCQQGDARGGRK